MWLVDSASSSSDGRLPLLARRLLAIGLAPRCTPRTPDRPCRRCAAGRRGDRGCRRRRAAIARSPGASARSASNSLLRLRVRAVASSSLPRCWWTVPISKSSCAIIRRRARTSRRSYRRRRGSASLSRTSRPRRERTIVLAGVALGERRADRSRSPSDRDRPPACRPGSSRSRRSSRGSRCPGSRADRAGRSASSRVLDVGEHVVDRCSAACRRVTASCSLAIGVVALVDDPRAPPSCRRPRTRSPRAPRS